MGALVAVLAAALLIAVELAMVYWISSRTGLYRWAQGVVGPPRRDTAVHARMQRLGAMFLCLVLISIPVQGGVIILGGILAAVGVL
jgi:hypothetical protein